MEHSKTGNKVVSCAISAALALGLAPLFAAPQAAVADDGASLAPAQGIYSVQATSGYGTAGTTFEEGRTYTVSTALMKADDTTAASMAASCIPATSQLAVAADGTVTCKVKLGSVKVGNITGYTKEMKIYDSATHDKNATATAVTVDSTQTVDGVTYPAEISFAIPANAKAINGVYVNLLSSGMPTAQDAFLSIDYANAKADEKADSTLTVKAKKKTLSAKAAKKTTFKASKAFKVKSNTSGGALTYKKTSGNKKITVSKSGKVTVKKGLKAGKTYTVKVKVTSAETSQYKSASTTVKLKIKVK